MENSRTVYGLDNEFIAQLARSLSLSMITQTNIVDHLRQVRVESLNGQTIQLTPEYKKYFEDMIEKLQKQVEEEEEASV